MEYISFDEAIALVAASGKGSTLIKHDLAEAFRHIPVASQDHWLLGFFWNGQYWLDCFLPFGVRTSPYLFDLFAKGIQFVIEADDRIRASFSAMHYLDDFLGIGRPGVNPTIYEERFQAACDTLGVQTKHSKSVTSTTVQFHGIEIDTLAMQDTCPSALRWCQLDVASFVAFWMQPGITMLAPAGLGTTPGATPATAGTIPATSTPHPFE